MNDRKTMELALKALEDYKKYTIGVMIPQTKCQGDEAITALREALTQPREPVAWIEVERGIPMFAKFAKGFKPKGDGLIPLYDRGD